MVWEILVAWPLAVGEDDPRIGERDVSIRSRKLEGSVQFSSMMIQEEEG